MTHPKRTHEIEIFRDVRRHLLLLEEAIHSPLYGKKRPTKLWGGADVTVRLQPLPVAPDRWFPEPICVVTPHAEVLSCLIYDLKHAFGQVNLGCAKEEFYGRLALAALAEQKRQRRQEAQTQQEQSADLAAQQLLSAVLREARRMAAEMRNHRFESLPVAVGGELAANRRRP